MSLSLDIKVLRKNLSEDLLKAMRSWDAVLCEELRTGERPAEWQVLGFVNFFDSASVHGRLTEQTDEDFEFRRKISRFWGCYLEKINAIEFFKVGEIIGGEESEGCMVRIDSVSEDHSMISTTVVATSDFWGTFGIQKEKRIEFNRAHTRADSGYDTWVPVDKSIPWFILSIELDGKKTFLYYR